MLQGTNQLSDDGELFVDGIHLTDLGMMRWANLLGTCSRQPVHMPVKHKGRQLLAGLYLLNRMRNYFTVLF